MTGRRQAVLLGARPGRRRPRRARRRGALPARPERRGQVDADQDPLGLLPARRGHDLVERRARSRFGHPQAAIKAGIATIYQELDLVPGLTRRREHLPGPRDVAPAGSPGGATGQRAAREILARLGPRRDQPHRGWWATCRRPASRSSAWRGRSRTTLDLLILDEPSAVLDHGEVENLFRVDPRPHRPGRRDRLHLPPAGGDPPDRRPDHGPQGRRHGRHRACRRPTPRPPS